MDLRRCIRISYTKCRLRNQKIQEVFQLSSLQNEPTVKIQHCEMINLLKQCRVYRVPVPDTIPQRRVDLESTVVPALQALAISRNREFVQLFLLLLHHVYNKN